MARAAEIDRATSRSRLACGLVVPFLAQQGAIERTSRYLTIILI
jgi:hypothetical protein